MRGLTRLLRWWASRLPRPSDDRGAVAATVAVTLGLGVLLGMGAVVVDVGRLYAEREQLQSGADAAAWAVAETCVTDPANCGNQADAGGTAQTYARANAADGSAAVSVICGDGPGLGECPAAAGNSTDCLGDAPADVSYAEVRTRTEQNDGGTLLPGTFSKALAGSAEGTEVGACSRVAWGPPETARGMAVIFSTCEFNEMTENGTVFWSPPANGTPPASAERTVFLKGGGTRTCPAGPSGWDAPGGFGWLDDPTRTCEATLTYDDSLTSNAGVSASQACREAVAASRAERRVLLIPIYDGVRGQGTNITYHVAGFASFVLTGYNLSGASANSWLTGTRPCTGSQRCLSGYFVRGMLPTTGVAIGGPDMGTVVVNLVG